MVFLTRHEESIKARPWLAFQQLLHNFSNLLLNIFFFFLCQKLSKFSGFQTLFFHKKQKCAIHLFHSLLSLPKKNSPRTNSLNSFCVSLPPFPKERRTNCLNSFVSPFSRVKEFKMTQSENSFNSSHSLIQKCSKD